MRFDGADKNQSSKLLIVAFLGLGAQARDITMSSGPYALNFLSLVFPRGRHPYLILNLPSSFSMDWWLSEFIVIVVG